MALYGAPALAIFDTSRPDVQQYFEHSARAWRERGFRYVSTDYLASAMSVPKYQDPTMTKVEVLRAGLEAIRRGLGDEVFYRKIGGGPVGVGMGLANDEGRLPSNPVNLEATYGLDSLEDFPAGKVRMRRVRPSDNPTHVVQVEIFEQHQIV